MAAVPARSRLLLTACLAGAAASYGAPPPAPHRAAGALEVPGSDVAGWVHDLHSPIYKTREAATLALLRLPPARADEVNAALEKERDDEAFSRLLAVAVHMEVRKRMPKDGELAMLGITLGLETVRLAGHAEVSGAVVVNEVQPGFPAEEYLKAGDRLVALNGEAFPADMDVTSFRERISGSPPGSVLRFTLVRSGRLMNAAVPLAAVPANMPLSTFVDARRTEAEQFVDDHRRRIASAPLVLPDLPAADGFEIRILPAGAARQEDLIGPPDQIAR
jgi:hypothetical protein